MGCIGSVGLWGSMKPVYLLGLCLALSACGSDPVTKRFNDPKTYTLEGSYTLNPCSFNYPSQLTLTDSEMTLNYASQGETRTFQSNPRYHTVDGTYGLVSIELEHPTGYCGVDHDASCSTPYTQLIVFSSFDQSTGLLGFGNCTYQHN
jgi:hypothetical protein